MAEGAERRRHPRVPLKRSRLSLRDAFGGEELGTVADLSQGGLLLYALRVIEPGAALQVKLHWQGPGQADSGDMEIGIMAQWSAPAGKPDNCWCGFQIIDISTTDQRVLESLIAAEAEAA